MEILQHLTCARNWKENLWSTVNFRNAGIATQSVSAKWLPRSPQEWSMAWVSQPPNPSVTCVVFWESQFGKSNENRPWTFRAPRNLTTSQVPSLIWISCLQYLGIFKIFKKPSHPSQAMVAHRSWQLLSSMFAKILLIEWNKMTCLQNTLFSKKEKQSCSLSEFHNPHLPPACCMTHHDTYEPCKWMKSLRFRVEGFYHSFPPFLKSAASAREHWAVYILCIDMTFGATSSVGECIPM